MGGYRRNFATQKPALSLTAFVIALPVDLAGIEPATGQCE